MFTDMVGYTALGQKNEVLSIAMIDEQRKLIRPILSRHNGTEIKTIGDAFLVEFASALDAVRCAYDIQRAIREFNISVPEGRKIQLRIGVHLGDVEESNGDILGDAVNVASRIERLAEEGGVCVTRQVYDHIQNKFELPMTNLGAKPLKNVDLPVEVYKMVMPWSDGKTTLQGQLDRERIAVLPLSNISQDKKDEYFTDGMTEELISTLSRIGGLKVISRTSVMRYKGTDKGMNEIAQELQVGTILEGSVRKANGDVRISAQLIDARNDEHLWSQDYDRKLEGVFAIQREIAQKVADALSVTLLSREKEDMGRQATNIPQAYTLYLKGRYFWNERRKESVDKAVKYFEEAIKLDPKFALAYSGLADCHILYGAFGWMKPGESFPRAKQFALRSIEIDPRLAEPHTTLAGVFDSYEGMWREAEAEYKRVLELKPSYALAHMWYGLLLIFLTRFEEALDQIKLAVELDPLSRVGDLNLASVHVYAGRPRVAVELLENVLKTDPDYAYNHNALGWAYFHDSKTEKGISELKEAVAISDGDPILKADLACALGFAGRREEAGLLLKELEETSKAKYVSKMKITQVLFAIGRNDEGFNLLQEAVEDHSVFTQVSSYLLDLRLLPQFAHAREDPRWDDFVRRLGIPQAKPL